MVRIKHRYLLINILYPNASDASSQPDKDIPSIVKFRQPSADALDAQTLSRAIRESVAHLFGDYGAGMISNNLKGMFMALLCRVRSSTFLILFIMRPLFQTQ